MRFRFLLLALAGMLLFGCNSSATRSPMELEEPDSQPAVQASATEQPGEDVTHTPEPTLIPATETHPPTLTPIEDIEGIEVIGSDPFVAQAERALAFLAACDPDALATADVYLSAIQESERSGMIVDEGVFLASDVTAFAPGYSEMAQVFWFAGTIIHDAHHRFQSQQGQTTNWGAMTLEEREALEWEARQVQVNALENCASSMPESTRYEWEFLLQYLIDMQTGVTECDYCREEWDDRNW